MNKHLKTIGNYKVIKNSIGQGSYSKIYKAYNQNEEIVAIKIIKKKNIKNEKLIKREISVLQSLKHKNIIHLQDVFTTNNRYYLIFDYCEYGDLKNYIYNMDTLLNETDVLYLMKQIKDGLQYLFAKDIVHRDLKPQNILINKDKIIKISDFGFAKIYDNSASMGQTLCGSPLYMAPEILTYKKYTDQADLWSVGVIIFELLFKETPVKGETIFNLISNMKQYNFKIHKLKLVTYSDSLIDLLEKLLQKNPDKRIKWVDFFNHPWFQLTNIKKQNSQEDMIFEMDELFEEESEDIKQDINKSILESSYENINKNYSVIMSDYNYNVYNDYLDNPQSSIEDDDKDFILIKKRQITTVPRSMPKNRFTDLIHSLRSSLSYLFTSPNSI